MAATLLVAFALLAATAGYWGVVRAPALRARDDDPRRVEYERHIQRGRILDRSGALLADIAVAADGTVTRLYPAPEAAPAVGYYSLRHGVGGIESAFDLELRGEAGRSAWEALWQGLLHRPPRGVDVVTTLDLELQQAAQAALVGKAGAVVILDVESGEILALASSPTFDPATLEEEWEELSEDPAAPLVNRATQGLYQPGGALQSVVLAEALSRGLAHLDAHTEAVTETLQVNGFSLGCLTLLPDPATLAEAYAAGCPAPFAALGSALGLEGMAALVARWGLDAPPPLEVPAEAADWSRDAVSTTAGLRAEAIGQGTLTVSPLQMALVAATLANDGQMPAPRLALRLHGGDRWEALPPTGQSRSVILPTLAHALRESWHEYEDCIIGHRGDAIGAAGKAPHAWFIGLAPADAPRYGVVVLVEHAAEPELSARVGVWLLRKALDSR